MRIRALALHRFQKEHGEVHDVFYPLLLDFLPA
jgi:hypothetical protein